MRSGRRPGAAAPGRRALRRGRARLCMPRLDGLEVCRRIRAAGDRTGPDADRARGRRGPRCRPRRRRGRLPRQAVRAGRAPRPRARADPPRSATTTTVATSSFAYRDLTLDLAARGRPRRRAARADPHRAAACSSSSAQPAAGADPATDLRARVGYDFGPLSNSLSVYIGYLRRKLESGGEPRLIQTVRGTGLRPARAVAMTLAPSPGAGCRDRRGAGGRRRGGGVYFVRAGGAARGDRRLAAVACGEVATQPEPQDVLIAPPARGRAACVPPADRPRLASASSPATCPGCARATGASWATAPSAPRWRPSTSVVRRSRTATRAPTSPTPTWTATTCGCSSRRSRAAALQTARPLDEVDAVLRRLTGDPGRWWLAAAPAWRRLGAVVSRSALAPGAALHERTR